ncbi:glycoside hydrolase [Fervidicella metallireducens AeB]|uniref:Glycoside hydrolase n=1 Tax=Fervidicella metallireducens AeB TaxID=1403537 RepID=A0A017RVT2_9CLOT|nr:M15 family metallopeptidase [Fervidicella metallireducens]EYE88716.1 glycoside hydrolase [Fervidicella metallireducens AeB]
MKNKAGISILFILAIIVSYMIPLNKHVNVTNKGESEYETVMKQDILCLMLSYPGYIVDLEKNNKNVYLITKNGRKILYDDRKLKSHEERLNNPDVQDMLEVIYPLGGISDLLEKDYDPGRIRVYQLFNEVYGNSKNEIMKNLVNVNIGSGTFQFNRENAAAESLNRAIRDILTIAKNNKTIGSYVFPCSGTFNYRYISGTSRLSPHSYGIAIDLARDKRDYWKWATREQGASRLKSYPKEIVSIFEKNNFIWGGKWGHFDILHFEYRPEIILKAKYFGDKQRIRRYWYEGISIDEEYTKNCIKKIEIVLGR